jgi:nucleotide-binding universal stress UspA family protein
MLPLRCILHPTDFSERSEYAYRLACSLARDYGARLLVVHVTPPAVAVYGDMILAPPTGVNFQEIKDNLLNLQGPGSPAQVEHRLEEGSPAEEILRVAKEGKCDLIVMGTHGRRGLGRLLIGSVAEQVMRRAPCPVVTVKTPFPAVSPVPKPPIEEWVTI